MKIKEKKKPKIELTKLKKDISNNNDFSTYLITNKKVNFNRSSFLKKYISPYYKKKKKNSKININ